jgi:hypothetical protein
LKAFIGCILEFIDELELVFFIIDQGRLPIYPPKVGMGENLSGFCAEANERLHHQMPIAGSIACRPFSHLAIGRDTQLACFSGGELRELPYLGRSLLDRIMGSCYLGFPNTFS